MRRQSPCSSCPFRSDIDFYLSATKVRAILEGLEGDEHFPCHNTTAATGNAGSQSKTCIGAAIFLEPVGPGGVRGNVAFRLREGCFHDFHRDELRMDSPMFSDVESLITARTKLMRSEVA